MNPREEQNLERLIGQAVRELPARRAPSSLEQRVQAEIARRAALPWWRKSFVHWPIAMRAAFVVICASVAGLAYTVVAWATAGVHLAEIKAAFAPEFRSVEVASRFVKALADFATVVFGAIPPLWLYAGLAVIVACYVTLFGVGAAAYRTLHSDR